MATYLILNILFVIAVIISLFVFKKFVFNKASLVALIILLILTAIFDSMIISFGIVDYDYSLLTGLVIGNAPIEDFFYTLLAVILIPSLWHMFHRSSNGKN